MDWNTVVAAITSSLGVTLAGGYWLARTLVQHELSKSLEQRKAELAQQLDVQKTLAAQDLERLRNALQLEQVRFKSELDAEIRKQVESQLGDIAAQRQYEYEARRRLYVAIGPLRFQLLLACRDLVSRIQSLGVRGHYVLHLDGYYARSTVYRLLKPVALAMLIEEQMTLADFSVDQAAIECLRFRRAVTSILSGGELAADHPKVDWTRQKEHVFADTLLAVVQALITRPAGAAARALRFDEFNDAVHTEGWAAFAPFDQLLNEFQCNTKPILWLRLVAYAYACNALVTRQGAALGFESQPFDTAMLLSRAQDDFINNAMDQMIARIDALDLPML
jgi:hypothetical protein